MNYKRAILFAVLLYLASFVIGLVVSLLLAPSLVSSALSSSFTILQLVIALLLSFSMTWWYFRSPTTVPSAKNGALFGAIAVLGGFAFDFVLFIPGLFSGYTFADLASFYAQPLFWTAVILVIAGAALAGTLRARLRRPDGNLSTPLI